jgi:hypothetical protein
MNITGLNYSYMKLLISGDRQIKDVQNDFSDGFAYLKIEFFKGNGAAIRSAKDQPLYSPMYKIKDISRNLQDGEIEVTESMTVKELEQKFKDQFNLGIQLFRKSGNLWLETTMTSSWTLQQQNTHGMEISNMGLPGAGDGELNA